MLLVIQLLCSCSWDVNEPELPAVTAPFALDGDFYAQLQQGNNVVYKATSQDPMHEDLAIGNGVFHFKFGMLTWHLFYNPASDQAHYMCFDPSCAHLFDQCLANKLKPSNLFVYYEGDLYCAYLCRQIQSGNSGITRISADGASMELLCRMNTTNVRGMKAGNGYIYVWKTGALYRYELATGELKTYTDKDSMSMNGLVVTDRGLITITNADPYVNLTDYDLGNKKPLFKRNSFVYSDDKVYYASNNYEEDGKTKKNVDLYEYDLATDKIRYICTQPTCSDILCVADGYLYYAPSYTSGKVTLNYSDKIVSVDIETGEAKEVYNSTEAFIKQMYCVNGVYYACVRTAEGFQCFIPSKFTSKEDMFGKLVDKDGDGVFELELFEWDLADFDYIYR